VPDSKRRPGTHSDSSLQAADEEEIEPTAPKSRKEPDGAETGCKGQGQKIKILAEFGKRLVFGRRRKALKEYVGGLGWGPMGLHRLGKLLRRCRAFLYFLFLRSGTRRWVEGRTGLGIGGIESLYVLLLTIIIC
jgi:hypothetical protein